MKMKKRLMAMMFTVAFIFSSLSIAKAEEVDFDYKADVVASDGSDDILKDDIEPLAKKDKAIVVLPGIMGSQLYDVNSGRLVWFHITNMGDILLNEDGTSINNIASRNDDDSGVLDNYFQLCAQLKLAFSSEFDIIFFDYDWRMSNTETATKLANEISSYSEVVFVAHSMGGLVVSKFLANSATNRAKTAAVVTIGTPYVGSAKCINTMETGDLIANPMCEDKNLFNGVVKLVCKNSYAAYQLLPTAKYRSITGIYPLSINGSVSDAAASDLRNAAWAKTSSGSTKNQLSAAATFHSSLLKNGSHVKTWSGIPWFTISGTGSDTISKVIFDENYNVVDLDLANSGDGTVLRYSAGYGTPTKTYSGSGYEHTAMVKNTTVISQVKTYISQATGVSASSLYDIASNEIESEEYAVNTRGWIEESDNRRIKIYADYNSTLFYNDQKIDETKENLYDIEGNRIGTVWDLGNTGRKMYSLYNGEYKLETNNDVTVKYMDSGYYDKIEEYSVDGILTTFHISDYEKKEIECVKLITTYSADKEIILPIRTYTENELAQLNQD